MKPTNQIKKAYRLNVDKNHDSIHSMSMITIQPKLIAKKPSNVRGKNGPFDLFGILHSE